MKSNALVIQFNGAKGAEFDFEISFSLSNQNIFIALLTAKAVLGKVTDCRQLVATFRTVFFNVIQAVFTCWTFE